MLTQKIKSLCAKNNYSVSKLEVEMGFARSSIDKWDRNAPSVWKVKAVADFFDVTVDELLKEPEIEE